MLLAAALIIPYFFFRDTGTLSFTRTELHALTATGREALERRQHRIVEIESPVLIFSGVLLAGGCLSLFLGGKRLREAQRKEDDAIDRQAKRDDYEIRKQSSAEVAGGQEAQAIENVVTTRVEERISAEDTTPSLPDEPPGQLVDSAAAPLLSTDESALARSTSEIARVETGAQQVLVEAKYSNFDFLPEISINTGFSNRKRIQLDGLFQSRSPRQADVVLELKVVSAPTRFLVRRSSAYSDQLLGLMRRYAEVTGREPNGWLLLVVTGPVEKAERKQWREIRDEIDFLLAGIARCTLMAENELNDAANRFRQIFEQ